ncbi:MAG: hypothetical protein AAB331_03060, partial [Planctomycetota bacterium]
KICYATKPFEHIFPIFIVKGLGFPKIPGDTLVFPGLSIENPACLAIQEIAEKRLFFCGDWIYVEN